MGTMDQSIIAYGTLYLDRDEDLEYAYASIERMSARKPVLYLYDIICRKDQLDEAQGLLGTIKNRIQEKCPHLPEDKIEIGITTDITMRPAEETLKRIIEESGGDIGLTDLNPKRPVR